MAKLEYAPTVSGVLVSAAAALALFAAPPASAQTPASTQADAMLVLDASGSMWGQIDGENKIVIARTVIAEIMGTWDEDANLGLIAYGHNRRGDCNDIETLVPLGSGTANSIAGRVNALNPKGMTPLSASVRMAAEALRFTERAATVILVTDGEENCGMDPCALGRQLAESGADFTAHVIAFDMRGMDMGPLQCLAGVTGGQFMTADNAGDLRGALGDVAETVHAASGGDRISAIVDDNGTPFTGDIYWTVFNAGPDGRAQGPYIDTGVGPTHVIRQPPGRYILQGKTRGNEVSGEILIEILDGEQQRHVLDMRSGTVMLRAIVNGEPGRKGVYWDLQWSAYELDADGKQGRRVVTGVTDNTVEDKAVRLRLRPGRYRIEGRFLVPQHGTKRTEVTITAGQEIAVNVDFP